MDAKKRPFALMLIVVIESIILVYLLIYIHTSFKNSSVNGLTLNECNESVILNESAEYNESTERNESTARNDISQDTLSATDILSDSPVISHSMGSINNIEYLNCLEGFVDQYAKGVRVFEVDLRMTHDLQVVLRHDWRAGWQDNISETSVPTLDEFLSKPLLGQYTPLSFRDLLLLMEKHPDICIVTDTKFTDAEIVTLQFEAMLQDAKELGLTYLFDRMVIQVYTPLMFKVVNSIYPFPHYIFTLYAIGFGQTEESFEEIAIFCHDNSIAGITMWDYWWDSRYAPIAAKYGLSVYTHTVNDPISASKMLSEGVSAVYTDILVPSDFS